MYLVLMSRVIFGVDGFMQDPQMGSQVRLFCFGLNISIAWGDISLDGNGYNIWTGLPKVNEVF